MLFVVKFWFLLGVFCITVLSDVDAKSLPSFITPCKRSDPDTEGCIKNIVENLRPRLAKGIPELGVPPCEPLVIPKLDLKQPEGASVGFDAVFTDMAFSNGLDFKIIRSNLDVDAGQVTLEISFPHLVAEGDYKSKGKIFIAQFEGEGRSKGSFENVTFSGVWNFVKEERRGKEYFKVTDTKTNVEVEKMHLDFENLFKNNKQLTDETNKLINENVDVLYNEVKPIIVQTLTGILDGVIQHVISQYSAEELLPTS